MLKISKALSAEKVGTYYEKEYTNRGEAYYSQEGQLRGQWHGKLAETFGLSGSVGKAEFDVVRSQIRFQRRLQEWRSRQRLFTRVVMQRPHAVARVAPGPTD